MRKINLTTLVLTSVLFSSLVTSKTSATMLLVVDNDSNQIIELNTDNLGSPRVIGTVVGLAADDLAELVAASSSTLFTMERTNDLLVTLDATDGSVKSTVALDYDVFRPRGFSLSPDGRLFAMLPGAALGVINTTTGESTVVAQVSGISGIEAIEFAPDGTLYALGAPGDVLDEEAPYPGSPTLFEIDIDTGGTTELVTLPVSDLDTLTYAEDGFLYCADASRSQSADLWRINPKTLSAVNLGSTDIFALNGITAFPPLAAPNTDKYKLDTGIFSTCATDENAAHCWGYPGVGSVPAHSRVLDLRTANYLSNCLIDADGLACWGESSDGVIPAPYIQDPIAVDVHTSAACALGSAGVVCWGNGASSLGPAPTLSNPRDIALAYGGPDVWACALDDTGVQCWGDNPTGAVMANVPTLVNPTQISVSVGNEYGHACAIDDTGVVCWGDNTFGQVSIPSLSNPVQVSAGNGLTCAVDDTGVVCWGAEGFPDCNSSNCGPGYDYGFLDIPELVDPFRVSVGYTHICALDRTGAVCWGRNLHGEADNQSLEFSLSNTTVAQLTDVSDINSNGVGEIAVLDSGPDGRLRMRIRDGASDTLLADIDFGTDVAIAVESIRDLDFSGNPEIAVLGRRPDGQVRVQIRDSVSGNLVRNLFYGSTYAPVSMRVIEDYNGNNAPEIAVMGSDSTDAIRVQAQDSGTGAILDNVFLGNQGIGQNFVAVNDTSGNGMPELGVLSVLKGNDQVRMQIWDAVEATFQANVWFGNVYQPHSMITMPDINSNGSDEIVAMGVDPATQNIRVQVRDSASAVTLYNIWLGAVNEAVDIKLINDINGNGYPDLAVLLKTATGTGRVRVQDGFNGAFIRNLFYTVVENPVGLAVMPDYSDNGFEELATLGENPGVRHVQVLDTAMGMQVNRIDFP